MAYTDYMKALKKGNKKYQSRVSKGEYPYLPVLDDILSHADIECEVNLGTMHIHLDQVVGTSNYGRTTAFASNFMPLLDYGSEFSIKWSALCDAQLEEGIRDSIKVYEYMNRYYVIEGNKRVSVLKYFDAVTIAADVIRKVPKRTDDIENIIYYEFMNFYKLTEMTYLTFSQAGCFDKLLDLTGHDHETVWTEDERMDFTSFYYAFLKEYNLKGGKKLPITVGDALLAFLNVYDYQTALDMSSAQIRTALDKLREEFLLLAKEDSVELLMNPTEAPKHKVLNKLKTSVPAKRLRVAFVYDRTPEQSDWIYGHELGRLHILDVFGDNVETTHVTCQNPETDGQGILEELIQDDYKIIFNTSTRFLQPSLKVAIDHPDVKILNCSVNISHSAIRTYEARLYEAKFLTGMIAGAMAKEDRIGYIADYPIYGAMANINAFAYGARMTNPRATIYLDWSTKRDYDVNEYFRTQGIHIISDQDLITPERSTRKFGLYSTEDSAPQNLATAICHWGIFYEKLLNTILSGSWKTEEATEPAKALNYWWGMSAGVIDVICSQKLPAGIKKLVDVMKYAICNNTFHPFSGPLYSQEGLVEASRKGYMTPEEIITMNWLAENVVGDIPVESELLPKAKPILNTQGVAPGSTGVLSGLKYHAWQPGEKD